MARTASGQQGISALTRGDVVTLVRREESNASIAHASGIDTFEPASMTEAAARADIPRPCTSVCEKGAHMTEFMRNTDAFTWAMESDPRLRSTVVTVLLLLTVARLRVFPITWFT